MAVILDQDGLPILDQDGNPLTDGEPWPDYVLTDHNGDALFDKDGWPLTDGTEVEPTFIPAFAINANVILQPGVM